MNKLFALILTLCMMATTLCVPASAALNINVNSNNSLRFGSMVGEGSLIMVVALAVLLILAAVLVIAVVSKKKNSSDE